MQAGLRSPLGGGAAGALKSTPLDDFIKDMNPDPVRRKKIEFFLGENKMFTLKSFTLDPHPHLSLLQ